MKFATEKERCDFILANKALVHYCLPPHIRDGKCIDDLEQEGFIGLILAVDRFDPSRNIKFSTYAIQYIDGYMRTFNNKNTLIKPLRNHFRNAGEASYLYKEITSIDRPHGYGEHATSLVCHT